MKRKHTIHSIRRLCVDVLDSSPKPLTFTQLARKVGLPLHVVVAAAFLPSRRCKPNCKVPLSECKPDCKLAKAVAQPAKEK